jgi:hypothetical protein
VNEVLRGLCPGVDGLVLVPVLAGFPGESSLFGFFTLFQSLRKRCGSEYL